MEIQMGTGQLLILYQFTLLQIRMTPRSFLLNLLEFFQARILGATVQPLPVNKKAESSIAHQLYNLQFSSSTGLARVAIYSLIIGAAWAVGVVAAIFLPNR